MRHNNVRNFEAELLAKTHTDVETAPTLPPVAGEKINGLNGDNARPHIRARGVWRRAQNAFFDVRVTNTNSQSQKHQTTERVLEKKEREKKRQYNNRIMNIEHGTFTPLVFSVFHKHIADKIARKTEQSYNDVISVIRCKLSFLILRSALLCIKGSRSHTKYEPVDDDLSLIFVKARM